MMKERPILFSGEMVRAILAGRKTQTRRVVNWKKIAKATECTKGRLYFNPSLKSWCVEGNGPADVCMVSCPYGQVGGRLWVKETFGFSRQDDDINDHERVVCFRADSAMRVTFAGVDEYRKTNAGEFMQPNHYVRVPKPWKPSIFMPRWASRITLEIVSVRVERLNEISEKDAVAEGCAHRHGVPDIEMFHTGRPREFTFVEAYKDLWQSINGVGSWAKNPWVWVIEFRRVRA